MKVSQSLRHLHTLAVQISKILATIQINAKETIEIRIKEEVGIIIIILKELLKKRAKMQREEHKEGMEVTEVVEIKISSKCTSKRTKTIVVISNHKVRKQP